MSFRCRSLIAVAVLTSACAATPASGPAAARAVLRVCADPNNLPFSNEAGQGFENRLAELLAAEMETTVQYTWWAQRRGFVRNTVRAGQCDVVMGVPADYELLAVTRPYYRASYVFLSRHDRDVRVGSLDDDELRHLTIGVHVIGDDYANPPPAHALAHRQIVGNVVGYSIFGDYRTPNPPARLIEAVLRGDIDLAIVWGPFAGYFSKDAPGEVRMIPVPGDPALPSLPFAFDIAVGVSRERPDLLASIDAILARQIAEVDILLDEFGIPHSSPSVLASTP